MDHPCHKCNQAVEDGTPFCRQCGAPQIRVVLPEGGIPASAGGGGISATEILERASPEERPILPHLNANASFGSRAFPACALAGLIGALVVELGVVPGIGMLGAGFLAVVFYRRRNLGAAVSTGLGAGLGALSGVFAFAFLQIVEMLGIVLYPASGTYRDKLLEILKEFSARNSDPAVQAWFDYLKTPAGWPALVAFILCTFLLTFLIVCTLGGALSAAFIRRRSR